MNEKIMIVEDDMKIADAIAYAFRREGYTVEVVYHGDGALKKINEFHPDALLLDVMLPGTDGYALLKKLQDKGHMGIIMLTAKSDIVDKILGLELGADDYITKPFDMRELLARVKSLLRRMQTAEESQEPTEASLGGVRLSMSKRQAYAGESLLDLTPKEFDLLALLSSHPDRVYTREQLLDQVWGMDYIGGTRTVDIHVQRLRKKLGDGFCDILQTVHGIGYKASGGWRG